MKTQQEIEAEKRVKTADEQIQQRHAVVHNSQKMTFAELQELFAKNNREMGTLFGVTPDTFMSYKTKNKAPDYAKQLLHLYSFMWHTNGLQLADYVWFKYQIALPNLAYVYFRAD